VQHGLVPVIVDIDPATLNIDINEAERAIGPKTKAVMPVHVYGNPCDMDALTGLCEKHNLLLIEDCCEALGAEYNGEPVGSFGRIATFSFYFSHHITTLEGGICVTNDFKLAEMLRILRAHGWTRDLEAPQAHIEQNPEVDPKFLFVNTGYNLRATELQGAIGLVQLPKLRAFVETRRNNAAYWQKELQRHEAFLDTQTETPKGKSSWFGVPITVKDTAPFDTGQLTAALNAAGIETRPIICGNIAEQPAMKLYPHRTAGDLRHASNVMKRAFSFANHQHIDKLAREYIAGHLDEIIQSHSSS